MLVIVFVLVALGSVIAQERPVGYLFYTASVINLDSNKTSYTVGCSLNYTGTTEDLSISSRHLVMTNLNRTPYLTRVINDTTIAREVYLRVSDELTICGNKEYVCRHNRTYIGMKTIHVARPPPAITPSDFKCISYNRKFLICEFERLNSCGLFTTYELSMSRLGLISDCELTDVDSVLSYDSRSETCLFSSGIRNIEFQVVSKNIIGQTDTSITVSHYDIVRPDAPANLLVTFVNSTSVQATWDLSIMLRNVDREIELEFQIISTETQDKMNKLAAVIAITLASLAAVSAQCPRIITRAGWGARAANTAVLPIQPAPWVVMHHTAGAHCTTDAACAQQMRNIQSFHIDGNGWADIGYNWCVGENGAAYEGRGWGRQGAHAPGFNDRSVGLCVMGTFTSGIPNLAARNAAQQLITCGVSLGHISGSYWLIGHRQASATACPGNAFFAEIQSWPRFNPNP